MVGFGDPIGECLLALDIKYINQRGNSIVGQCNYRLAFKYKAG